MVAFMQWKWLCTAIQNVAVSTAHSSTASWTYGSSALDDGVTELKRFERKQKDLLTTILLDYTDLHKLTVTQIC